MQDIDFSQHMQGPVLPLASEQAIIADSKNPKKKPTFLFTPLLVTALLTFSLGLVSGIFLGQAKNIEKNIISRPDNRYFSRQEIPEKDNKNKTEIEHSRRFQNRAKKEIKSFTNISSAKSKEASFLIKVGVYPSKKAQNLVKRINLLPEFSKGGVRAHRCKDIKRLLPFSPEQPGFAIPVPGMPQQENVLLGCFASKSLAKSLLTKILYAKMPEVQEAQLFQITD